MRSSYVAGHSAATGGLLFDHEDYVHKSKCLVSQLRCQDGKNSPGPLLLSKASIDAAAREEGLPMLSHITGVMSANADAQNVPSVEALLYDEELQVGAWRACRVLLASTSLLPCVAALCPRACCPVPMPHASHY